YRYNSLQFSNDIQVVKRPFCLLFRDSVEGRHLRGLTKMVLPEAGEPILYERFKDKRTPFFKTCGKKNSRFIARIICQFKPKASRTLIGQRTQRKPIHSFVPSRKGDLKITSTETREPGAMEDETMAGSESQTLQLLESGTTSSRTLPIKAAREMRDGYFSAASSRDVSSCSLLGGVNGDETEEEAADGEDKSLCLPSELEGFNGVFEFFFLEGIFSQLGND
ncbi:transposon protein, partial [Striga asiatica]